jgi:hypothetical protein
LAPKKPTSGDFGDGLSESVRIEWAKPCGLTRIGRFPETDVDPPLCGQENRPVRQMHLACRKRIPMDRRRPFTSRSLARMTVPLLAAQALWMAAPREHPRSGLPNEAACGRCCDQSAAEIRFTRGNHACPSVPRHGLAPKKPTSGDFGDGFGESVQSAASGSATRCDCGSPCHCSFPPDHDFPVADASGFDTTDQLDRNEVQPVGRITVPSSGATRSPQVVDVSTPFLVFSSADRCVCLRKLQC